MKPVSSERRTQPALIESDFSTLGERRLKHGRRDAFDFGGKKARRSNTVTNTDKVYCDDDASFRPPPIARACVCIGGARVILIEQ